MNTPIEGAPRRRRINWSIITTLVLLGAIFFAARYAVQNWRRPGAMGVIEAQAMDMTVMKPPVGAVPVAVYTALRGGVEAKVSYTGSAVAWTDQDIAARVTGRIVDMPVYPGSRVRRGQLLVRLDSDELRSREAEAQAMSVAAQQQTRIAQAGTRQAEAMRQQARAEAGRGSGEVREAQAELQSARAMINEASREQDAAREGVRDAQAALEAARRGVVGAQADVNATEREAQMRAAEVDDTRAMLDDAKQEAEGASAMVEQAKSRLPQAQADVEAARAEALFQREKVKRSAALFKQGAISREELQQDESTAQSAESRVRQTNARVSEVQGDINAAQATARQAQAKIRAAEARIRAAQGNAEAAKARIAGAQAKVSQMQAEVQRAAVGVRQRQAEVAAVAARVGRTRAEAGAAAAKIEQARQSQQASLAAAQSAVAGVDKSEQEAVQAGLTARQARAALSTARVVRGYTEIRAATDGVVTQRVVAPGSLVNPGSTIMRVAQISPIRFQANVAQADIAQIRLGTPVTIRSTADDKKTLQTTISALFPSADAQSRTGIVEAIAPNSDERFKPGEFIVMEIVTTRGSGGLKVPSGAIVMQTVASEDIIASRQTPMVWTMNEAPSEGKQTYFCTMHPEVEQDHPGICPKCNMKLVPKAAGGKYRAQMVEVKTGANDGEWTEILGGLEDGAKVIYRGYENLKNGAPVVPANWGQEGPSELPQVMGEPAPGSENHAGHGANVKPIAPSEPAPDAHAGHSAGTAQRKANLQTASIIVKGIGFEPSQVTLKAGIPAKLTFKRVEAEGCGTEVIFPDLKIKKDLPLNKPVTVEFTPQKSGSLSFSCGMDMLKGTVIVK